MSKIIDFFKSSPVFNNFASLFIVLMLSFVSFLCGALLAELRFVKKDELAAIAANNQAAPPQGVPSKKDNLEKPSTKDTIRGNKNAEIALIEYSDIDCPFCQRFHTTAKEVLEQNKDKLMWVYRDFPLETLHPEATKKSIGANCVNEIAGIDKFWQFLDILYERTEKASDMPAIASEIGVDRNKFNDCYNSNKTKPLVDADLSSGSKAGVNGTPGNFVMNIKTGMVVELRGAVPASDVQAAIDTVSKQ